MAMRTVPASFTTIRFLGVREKMRDDDRQTNSDGLPAWSVDVQVDTKDRNGYPAFENIAVTIYAVENPARGIQQLAQVEFKNLRVGAFQQGTGTGFYFSATSVEKISQRQAG